MKRRTYITLRIDVAGTMPQPIVDACGGGRSGFSRLLRH